MNKNIDGCGTGIEAVITSFNQGTMILEAVGSLCAQTLLPQKIIIVDDGSTDEGSIRVLKDLENKAGLPIPVKIHYQENRGVSAARNAGIQKAQAPMVLVLDGDDKLKPEYIEYVSQMLLGNPSMVAASSWMHTFGTLDSVVCPLGGKINAFLSRNCCPATHILRRDVFEQCGGYDESMRSGFEDWDFFLSMLETSLESSIGIVDKPLIQYRTAPASSNVKSMEKRLGLMRFIIEKHKDSYHGHMVDALLGIEAISNSRLYQWETEVAHAIASHQEISQSSHDFLKSPTYGDGGMASAVRIASDLTTKLGQDRKE
ncbi:glycosyltransferase family A protein [Lachnospiraceae bacterium 29-84]